MFYTFFVATAFGIDLRIETHNTSVSEYYYLGALIVPAGFLIRLLSLIVGFFGVGKEYFPAIATVEYISFYFNQFF